MTMYCKELAKHQYLKLVIAGSGILGLISLFTPIVHVGIQWSYKDEDTDAVLDLQMNLAPIGANCKVTRKQGGKDVQTFGDRRSRRSRLLQRVHKKLPVLLSDVIQMGIDPHGKPGQLAEGLMQSNNPNPKVKSQGSRELQSQYCISSATCKQCLTTNNMDLFYEEYQEEGSCMGKVFCPTTAASDPTIESWPYGGCQASPSESVVTCRNGATPITMLTLGECPTMDFKPGNPETCGCSCKFGWSQSRAPCPYSNRGCAFQISVCKSSWDCKSISDELYVGSGDFDEWVVDWTWNVPQDPWFHTPGIKYTLRVEQPMDWSFLTAGRSKEFSIMCDSPSTQAPRTQAPGGGGSTHSSTSDTVSDSSSWRSDMEDADAICDLFATQASVYLLPLVPWVAFIYSLCAFCFWKSTEQQCKCGCGNNKCCPIPGLIMDIIHVACMIAIVYMFFNQLAVTERALDHSSDNWKTNFYYGPGFGLIWAFAMYFVNAVATGLLLCVKSDNPANQPSSQSQDSEDVEISSTSEAA